MNEVGKYKDTQKYLPQVKQQLKIMQKIVEDILYLNHCTEHMEKESFDLKGLADEIVLGYQVQASTNNLTFRIEGASGPVCTDRDMLKKIVDNLVSNAVSYTPAGNLIIGLPLMPCTIPPVTSRSFLSVTSMTSPLLISSVCLSTFVIRIS